MRACHGFCRRPIPEGSGCRRSVPCPFPRDRGHELSRSGPGSLPPNSTGFSQGSSGLCWRATTGAVTCRRMAWLPSSLFTNQRVAGSCRPRPGRGQGRRPKTHQTDFCSSPVRFSKTGARCLPAALTDDCSPARRQDAPVRRPEGRLPGSPRAGRAPGGASPSTCGPKVAGFRFSSGARVRRPSSLMSADMSGATKSYAPASFRPSAASRRGKPFRCCRSTGLPKDSRRLGSPDPVKPPRPQPIRRFPRARGHRWLKERLGGSPSRPPA